MWARYSSGVFSARALAIENARRLPALVWLILQGVLFADATVTLMRRTARRECWYAAQRTPPRPEFREQLEAK
jgi:hypothetical protein